MDLDATGWPQLPTVGSKIEFHGGDILLQALGVCTIIRADHVCNAAGQPGGRVTIQTDRGELVEITLSDCPIRGFKLLRDSETPVGLPSDTAG